MRSRHAFGTVRQLMTDRTAWIVTDKRASQERFEDALATKCGCEVAVIAWASLLDGDLPLSNPQWILVDLAHGDNWQHLPLVQRRLNKAVGLATAKIAIIDRGYPLEWANTADRTFAASLGAHASLA